MSYEEEDTCTFADFILGLFCAYSISPLKKETRIEMPTLPHTATATSFRFRLGLG
jgi:hypothetical protein